MSRLPRQMPPFRDHPRNPAEKSGVYLLGHPGCSIGLVGHKLRWGGDFRTPSRKNHGFGVFGHFGRVLRQGKNAV